MSTTNTTSGWSIAKKKYIQQAHRARNRGIEFIITFEEWYQWWLDQGIDKNLHYGKFTGDTKCMCRKGDVGPYSLENIYCDIARNNSSRPGKLNPRYGTPGRNQYSK